MNTLFRVQYCFSFFHDVQTQGLSIFKIYKLATMYTCFILIHPKLRKLYVLHHTYAIPLMIKINYILDETVSEDKDEKFCIGARFFERRNSPCNPFLNSPLKQHVIKKFDGVHIQ